MIRSIFFLRVVLVCAALCGASVAAGDPPYFSGFETDATGAMPAGWAAVGGGSQMVIDSVPARGGD